LQWDVRHGWRFDLSARHEQYFSLASADLVVPNQDAWHLLWDFKTLSQISETLPGNTSLQNKALVATNEIINVFDHRIRRLSTSVARLQRMFSERVAGERREDL